jgi:hypothetical protein
MDTRCTLPSDEVDAELIFESFREDFQAFHEFGWEAYEGTYSPSVNIKFNVDYIDVKTDIERPRIFEVERQQRQLLLWGLYLLEVSDFSEQINVVTDYLEGEGCTDVICSFRTLRDYRWRE